MVSYLVRYIFSVVVAAGNHKPKTLFSQTDKIKAKNIDGIDCIILNYCMAEVHDAMQRRTGEADRQLAEGMISEKEYINWRDEVKEIALEISVAEVDKKGLIISEKKLSIKK